MSLGRSKGRTMFPERYPRISNCPSTTHSNVRRGARLIPYPSSWYFREVGGCSPVLSCRSIFNRRLVSRRLSIYSTWMSNVLEFLSFGFGLAIVLLLLSARLTLWQPRSRLPFPPGPRSFPLFGSLLNMIQSDGWDTYHKWATEYGDVVHITMLGKSIILLNSHEIASDFLTKKSAVCSDRPDFTMASKVTGNEKIMPISQYHISLKTMRRWFSILMGTRSSVHLWDLEEQITRSFIKKLHSDINIGDYEGRNLQNRIKWSAAALNLRITYGYWAVDENDPLIMTVETVVEYLLEAFRPAWIVNFIPVLRHLPDTLSFPSSINIGRRRKIAVESLAQEPLDFVKGQMVDGIAPLSFTRTLLEENGPDINPEDELNIKWAAFSLFAGGVDTVPSAIYAFFLAMTLNPYVQERAHRELDAVLLGQRFPTLQDRRESKFPYLDALVKELIRWAPVLPAGIPHVVTQETEYRGWRIPKGSCVIANLFTISRDDSIYPVPDEFRPERFLTKDRGGDCETHNDIPVDPSKISFGYGKRSCPGRRLAELHIWLSVAMSLTVYTISAVKGHEPSMSNYDRGAVSRPKPFKCRIRVRSKQAEEIIKAIPEEEIPVWMQAYRRPIF
ncbi:cytochrome P450 [Sistotremastrum suecicum HHB10207 ss-3]|uniref:Cytochrome P450 n=1 Tax=Sistotremastrum suecicum HHB10207 ss-3 TaxID=1314776 RepID=A0A166CYY1_9AGAM|nr:cytochrome P450 [Sistotremastrum suecicum HHB10207 ss-3]